MFNRDLVTTIENLNEIKNLEFNPIEQSAREDSSFMEESKTTHVVKANQNTQNSTNSDSSNQSVGFRLKTGETVTTEDAMIYISFKKILEQFFALYEKSSTDKIRKIKSMLQ